jgi:hypothetical protein
MERNKLFNVMLYKEFDELVNKHFPITNNRYECVAEQEWHNDSNYAYEVEAKDFTEYYRKRIFEENNFMYCAGEFLNKLCFDGIIEPGAYLIEVYW